jgi:hypothetical protein
LISVSGQERVNFSFALLAFLRASAESPPYTPINCAYPII